jgi:hypothetical protein
LVFSLQQQQQPDARKKREERKKQTYFVVKRRQFLWTVVKSVTEEGEKGRDWMNPE